MEDLAWELDVPFTFERRPSPMDGEYRPAWRVALLALMLDHCCRGGRSSFPRLHLLNWAARSSQGRALLLRAISEGPGIGEILIRYEPSFARSISLAAGLGIVRYVDGKRVVLTPDGRAAASALAKEGDILEREKQFFDELGYQLTEKLVGTLVWGGT